MDATQVLALTLAGVVAVPLLQVLKTYLKMDGAPFAWVAFVAALLMSGIAGVVTGRVTWAVFGDPGALFAQGSIVFAVAQVVYRSLKERLKPKK